MIVGKYKADKNLTVGKKLILKGDSVYLEKPNGAGGFYKTCIFTDSRDLIGEIDKDKFYDFEKNFTEIFE